MKKKSISLWIYTVKIFVTKLLVFFFNCIYICGYYSPLKHPVAARVHGPGELVSNSFWEHFFYW